MNPQYSECLFQITISADFLSSLFSSNKNNSKTLITGDGTEINTSPGPTVTADEEKNADVAAIVAVVLVLLLLIGVAIFWLVYNHESYILFNINILWKDRFCNSFEKNDSKNKKNGICLNILNYTLNYKVFFILLNSLTFKLQIWIQICRFRQIIRPIFYCNCTIRDGGIPCIYLKRDRYYGCRTRNKVDTQFDHNIVLICWSEFDEVKILQ